MITAALSADTEYKKIKLPLLIFDSIQFSYYKKLPMILYHILIKRQNKKRSIEHASFCLARSQGQLPNFFIRKLI